MKLAEEEQQDELRTYSFPHSGYIPGVPGMWSGGSRVTVNERTREVIDVWPVLIQVQPDTQSEQSEAVQNAPQGQGEALPEQEVADVSNPLTDAIKQLGG